MESATEKAKEAQRFVEIYAQTVHDSRGVHHRWATAFDEVADALNEGLGCVHKLVAATATATRATSIGTGDRTEDEQDYFQKALMLLTKMLNEEGREDYELVTVEDS